MGKERAACEQRTASTAGEVGKAREGSWAAWKEWRAAGAEIGKAAAGASVMPSKSLRHLFVKGYKMHAEINHRIKNGGRD